jgi:hypothetical protein
MSKPFFFKIRPLTVKKEQAMQLDLLLQQEAFRQRYHLGSLEDIYAAVLFFPFM